MSPLLPSYRSETSDHWTGAWDWAARSGPDGGTGHHGRGRAERVDERAAGRCANCTGARTLRRASNQKCGPRRVGFFPAIQESGGQDFAGGRQRFLFASCSGVCTGAVADAGELAAWAGSQDVSGFGGGHPGVFVSGSELVLAGAEAVVRLRVWHGACENRADFDLLRLRELG
jgi:hypothetical protein